MVGWSDGRMDKRMDGGDQRVFGEPRAACLVVARHRIIMLSHTAARFLALRPARAALGCSKHRRLSSWPQNTIERPRESSFSSPTRERDGLKIPSWPDKGSRRRICAGPQQPFPTRQELQNFVERIVGSRAWLENVLQNGATSPERRKTRRQPSNLQAPLSHAATLAK